MISLDDAAEYLRRADDIVILSHQFPDGDTFGSAAALCMALQSMGKRAKTRCRHAVSAKYAFMFRGVKKQEFEPKTVVAVDVADIDLLGEPIREEYEGRVDLCIDHHAGNRTFAKYTYVDSTAAATTEIIYALITKLGAKITPEIAEAIYTGITTDTGCFKYTNATPRTYRIAACMMETGIDAAAINREMFDTKTRARLEMERRVLDSMNFYLDDRCAVVYILRDMIAESGACEDDLEGLAAIPRQIEGVLVGVTLREKKSGEYKVSLRTQEPVNAAQICALFDGGGHACAAGCTLPGPKEAATERIVAAIGAYLEQQKGGRPVNGVLVVDKPADYTSFDVVAVVRRLAGREKTGHTGTLDPMATGVLPILLGKATRAASLLEDTSKEYRAEFAFGYATDTQDSTGEVLGAQRCARDKGRAAGGAPAFPRKYPPGAADVLRRAQGRQAVV